jgi:hypothetical protein
MNVDETISRFALAHGFPYRKVENHYWEVNGIDLYSPEHPEQQHLGLKTWDVIRITVIPGVRTLPNGDPGYPDEYDTDIDSSHSDLWAALKRIGVMSVLDWVDASAEADAMFEAFQESQDSIPV